MGVGQTTQVRTGNAGSENTRAELGINRHFRVGWRRGAFSDLFSASGAIHPVIRRVIEFQSRQEDINGRELTPPIEIESSWDSKMGKDIERAVKNAGGRIVYQENDAVKIEYVNSHGKKITEVIVAGSQRTNQEIEEIVGKNHPGVKVLEREYSDIHILEIEINGRVMKNIQIYIKGENGNLMFAYAGTKKNPRHLTADTKANSVKKVVVMEENVEGKIKIQDAKRMGGFNIKKIINTAVDSVADFAAFCANSVKKLRGLGELNGAKAFRTERLELLGEMEDGTKIYTPVSEFVAEKINLQVLPPQKDVGNLTPVFLHGSYELLEGGPRSQGVVFLEGMLGTSSPRNFVQVNPFSGIGMEDNGPLRKTRKALPNVPELIETQMHGYGEFYAGRGSVAMEEKGWVSTLADEEKRRREFGIFGAWNAPNENPQGSANTGAKQAAPASSSGKISQNLAGAPSRLSQNLAQPGQKWLESQERETRISELKASLGMNTETRRTALPQEGKAEKGERKPGSLGKIGGTSKARMKKAEAVLGKSAGKQISPLKGEKRREEAEKKRRDSEKGRKKGEQDRKKRAEEKRKKEEQGKGRREEEKGRKEGQKRKREEQRGRKEREGLSRKEEKRIQKRIEELGRRMGAGKLSSSSLKSRFKAILFDMDGVMALSEEFHRKSFNEVLKGFGIFVGKKEWAKRYAGTGSPSIMRDLFARHKINEDAAEWVGKRSEQFMKMLDSEKLAETPGIRKMLKWVTVNGIRVMVVSGGHGRSVEKMLKNMGITGLNVIGREDVKVSKPSPEGYLKAAGMLGVSPSDCLVFEDSPTGVKAAQNAGMICAGVLTTNRKNRLKRAGADFFVRDFRDKRLAKLLFLLFGKRFSAA